jgi:hypothetical protein
MPSPKEPLAGTCACGTVRFQVTGAFSTAGFCHCHRCQRRAGTPWSMNGMVKPDELEILAGSDSVTYWRPEDGLPKAFCSICGGHVWSGEPGSDIRVGIRIGALHDDPGLEPSWRQWLSSAQPWVPIPQDGLPRYPEARPT